jgi:hypothetical protein
VAYRVITGILVLDHATIARFICRHERALAELFSEVLKLCAEAGLVRPGVVSIDATRIAGNASPEFNTSSSRSREIVAEVKATDEAQDEEFGEARGDELPEKLRSAEGRREFFRQAHEQMRREQQSPEPAGEAEATDELPLQLDVNQVVGRGRQGRDAWLREGKRRRGHRHSGAHTAVALASGSQPLCATASTRCGRLHEPVTGARIGRAPGALDWPALTPAPPGRAGVSTGSIRAFGGRPQRA